MNLYKLKFILGVQEEYAHVYKDGCYNPETGAFQTSTTQKCSWELRTIRESNATHVLSTFMAVHTWEGGGMGSYMCLYDANDRLVSTVGFADFFRKGYRLPDGTAKYTVTLRNEDYANVPKGNYLYFGQEREPLYSKLSLNWNVESGRVFGRTAIDTDLHFIGEDFDYIESIDINRNFVISVVRVVLGLSDYEATDFFGSFGKTDCRFDYVAHNCVPTIHALDPYTNLLAHLEDEFDLCKLEVPLTRVTSRVRPVIQLYCRGASVLTQCLGGTHWETEVQQLDDYNELIDKYHFGRVAINCQLHVEMNGDYGIPSGTYTWSEADHRYVCDANPDFNYLVWLGSNQDGTYGVFMKQTDALKGYGFAYRGSGLDFEHDYIPYTSYDVPAGRLGSEEEPVQIVDNVSAVGSVNVIGRMWFSGADCLARVVGNFSTFQGNAAFDIPSDDFALESNRNYKKCYPYTQGFFYESEDYTLTPNNYGLVANYTDRYYTNENLPIEGGLDGLKPIPICKYEWGATSYWYNFSADYVMMDETYSVDYQLRDCYTLLDLLKTLVGQIDPTIEVSEYSSRFLLNRDPQQSFLVNMPAWYLCFTQKSNVLKGDYDQAAQKAPIKLSELFDYLANQFNCYWALAWMGGTQWRLILEHKEYFDNGWLYNTQPAISDDLTSPAYKDLFAKKPLLYWQDACEYDMSGAAKRIEFNQSEDGTEWFKGLYVNFNNSYLVEASVQEKTTGIFSSDIDFMLIQPDKFGLDGFAVLGCFLSDGVYSLTKSLLRVYKPNGYTHQAIVTNYFASFLSSEYWFLYGVAGGLVELYAYAQLPVTQYELSYSARTVARLRTQNIRVPFFGVPSEGSHYSLVKTYRGAGIVIGVEHDTVAAASNVTLALRLYDVPTD